MLVSEINDLVKALDDNKKNVDFRPHIGGRRYVSVTSGAVSIFGNCSVQRVQTR